MTSLASPTNIASLTSVTSHNFIPLYDLSPHHFRGGPAGLEVGETLGAATITANHGMGIGLALVDVTLRSEVN